MHYDYYRPEVPESVHSFNPMQSYLYGHGCHTTPIMREVPGILPLW